MWCKGLSDFYKPTFDYITFDFETVEERIHGCAENSIQTIASIHPLSVSASVDNITNIYFDVSDEAMDKINYYAEQQDIPILGFNSAKFDMNLFLSELECDDWFIDRNGCLCTETNMRMIRVVKINKQFRQVCTDDEEFRQVCTGDEDDDDIDDNGEVLYKGAENKKWVVDKKAIVIIFKDFINYVSPGTLETHAKDFGGVKNTKSHMAYEAFHMNNFMEVLSVEDPFTKDDFFSSLKNKGYSDEEYADYLKDWNMLKDRGSVNTRWDYLEYNDKRDTQIMRPMIDTFVKKFAMAYDDFSMNGDYSSEEDNQLPPYELDEYVRRKMCSGYRKQDTKAERDIEGNVCLK
jgi:hypothetical protein